VTLFDKNKQIKLKMNDLFSLPYHAFLSYSHKDRETALKFHQWLTRDAGFKIWFDEHHLEAGSSVAARLAEKMADCRNWILLASKNSIASDWVKAERDQALHCSTSIKGFNLVIIRIDECPLGQVWPSMSRFNWLDMPGGLLTPGLAREVIDRLDCRSWSGRQTGLHDVFVSRGWRPADNKFADSACEGLCARQWQLRLIGDVPDQISFSIQRIREIISSCSGHILILPRRGSGNFPSEQDYRYLFRELEISKEIRIPVLLLAEAGTPLPESLLNSVKWLEPGEDYHSTWAMEPPEWLDSFIDELKEPPVSRHLFLAAEFKDNVEKVANLREFIESVTGVTCKIGRDFEGQGLRDQIVSNLSNAAVVVANLTSKKEVEQGNTSVNFNTCVEAGIALGSFAARGVAPSQSQVFLTAQYSPGEKDRTARLPFMFQDAQITWYESEVELLAHCRRLLLPYRRRIMNFEFSKTL
jgi:hypothetical protein